jgi:hypothetical protein
MTKKAKTKAKLVGTMAADHAKFAAPGRVAARRKRTLSVTVRGLVEILRDRYEALEEQAGEDKLWILADEYRTRSTTCNVMIEHLLTVGFDVDAIHEIDAPSKG